MHLVDSPGHVANQYSAGNPGLGIAPTQVGKDLLNDLMNNVAYVVTNGGVALTKGRTEDLRDGIVALILAHAPSAADASTTVKGIVELATGAEAAALTDAVRAITPLALASVVATAVAKGIVELATDAETATGTDTTRALTPANLASLVASATARGIVELATNAEVATGTDTVRAVTPAGLASLVATTTLAGISELATGAEAAALTDASRSVTPLALASVTASATAIGMVELATNAEVATGSDTTRAVTPAGLASLLATTAVKGLIEIATTAESIAGTDTSRAVTPEGLAAVLQGIAMTYAADSNAAANTITITLVPAPAAYTTGMRVWTKVNVTNTGSVTVNVNGLGNKTVKRAGAVLPAGTIIDGQMICLAYDGTDFQLLGGLAVLASLSGVGGWIQFVDSGLIIQVGTVNPTSTGSGTGGEVTWTYPMTFPNACWGVWPSIEHGVGGALGGGNMEPYSRSAGFSSAIVGIDDGAASAASWATRCIAFGY